MFNKAEFPSKPAYVCHTPPFTGLTIEELFNEEKNRYICRIFDANQAGKIRKTPYNRDRVYYMISTGKKLDTNDIITHKDCNPYNDELSNQIVTIIQKTEYTCEDEPYKGLFCKELNRTDSYGKHYIVVKIQKDDGKIEQVRRARFKIETQILKRRLEDDERIGYKNGITGDDSSIDNLFVFKVEMGERITPSGVFSDATQIYKVFSKNNGRYSASIHYPNGKHLSTSYARYLMCMKEGRMLTDDEEVDHIDGNRLNDDINNLQILSTMQNQIKRDMNNEINNHECRYIIYNCPICGLRRKRRARDVFKASSNRRTILFCSNVCQGKYVNFSTEVKDKMADDFKYEYVTEETSSDNVYNLVFENQTLLDSGSISNGVNPYDMVLDEDGFAQFTDIGINPYDMDDVLEFLE